jgi:hypothetical protein
MNDKSANGSAGYLFHDLAYFVLNLVPRALLQWWTLKLHKSMRSKAYVKYSQSDPLKK